MSALLLLPVAKCPPSKALLPDRRMLPHHHRKRIVCRREQKIRLVGDSTKFRRSRTLTFRVVCLSLKWKPIPTLGKPEYLSELVPMLQRYVLILFVGSLPATCAEFGAYLRVDACQRLFGSMK